MSDLVVTVPKWFWPDWIAEGDAAGEPATGEEWGFYGGGPWPPIEPGERVYIVAHGLLRGFAPLTRIGIPDGRPDRWALCREGGAVAVTIPETIQGFRGWRKRWWDRAIETPFLDWKTRGVNMKGQNRPAWAR